MKLFSSFCIAFSMYSRIPMPRADWKEENMRYCMCFFPLVGAVAGAALMGLCYLGKRWSLPEGLLSMLLTLLPVVLTGGIHLDGYLDTLDALASYGDQKKKLDILKDSHVGAFAVIGCVTYFFVTYGLWMGILGRVTTEGQLFTAAGAVGFGMVLSRAFSGLSVITFGMAKNTGLAALFSGAAQKRTVRTWMAVYLAAGSAAAIWLGHWYGVFVLAACGGTFFYYHRLAEREFGGITGDLAGYYVCLAELLGLAAVTVGVMILC